MIKFKSLPVYNPQIILYRSKDNTLIDQKIPLQIITLYAQITQTNRITFGIDMLLS